MNRTLLSALLIVLVVMVLSACAPGAIPAAPSARQTVVVPQTVVVTAAAPAAPAQASLKGKRLCITSPVTLEILNIFYDDMRAAAADSGLGLEITVTDAKGDFAKQLADV